MRTAALLPLSLATLLLSPLWLACNDYKLSPSGEVGGDTGGLPDCSSFAAPSSYTVAVEDECVREPEVGSFDPVIEWQWQANTIYDGYDDIMAAPAIANLTDDDGDGDIDEDDIPDIVFANFAGGAYTSAGTLTAISGDGSGMLWSVYEPGGEGIHGSSAVAIGDLDGDGRIEVCASGTTSSVVCVNGADGSLIWAAGTTTYGYGAPAMADMDGDGLSEVLWGNLIFGASGRLLAEGVGTTGKYMSYAVDMDDDGDLELVTANTVWHHDGTVLWSTGSTSSAYSAVGDFDGDHRPEVAWSGNGTVGLVDDDGTVLWSAGTVGTGNGGPPTVADFDGDGEPEIGVADLSTYSVFDADGTVLWSNPVSDYSSSQTGSAVFDFEGDGNAEVVYADEHTLWIFDGRSGAIELEQGGHASGTLMEYPLIADVDNDGSTEIIVPSNDYGIDGWNGITVVGDREGSWAPARKIWNQHAYHITNVNNDGSVPSEQTQNWLTWNNFRAGGTELGPSHWLAQLAPASPSTCIDECHFSQVTVYLPIENRGLLGTTAFDVVFLSDGEEVTRETITALDSGEVSILGPFFFAPGDWGDNLQAVVDLGDGVDECDEGDNRWNLGAWPCG